ncbi:DnaJ-like chaperonin [Mycobacterium phage ILeeKay]|uniref:DnaJ-like protein n=1 Tax=Mycobacterium phage Doom TaxID=2922222 RepID=G1EV43_9CAUD|nr:DnaJ-like protein [Mycobacterium phage Doom]YP_009031270.1 DnaJ-like protein [Mycobacterium phage Seabiscuit]ATN89429.1 DnaJ-like chaperonin [Mycobacterium phage ILeeKay]AVO25700.1 hypothetical protein SEA_MCGUIRE_83 [Mycobacterium phage McGuire]AXH68018.1 DnaJ-like chaperonin [Mycobacterium phage Sibs6]QGH75521.1 DnaJ-like chaperonin [Mycobacterium phage BaconJack]QGJ90689.1 hypothetical protein SEA_BRITON15_86 [Mycobacterium phage Briton15]QOP65954.1 DnaJ-like chaperonin [Mycobacterium 
MIRQMLVCPTCDGSGAGSAPIKGFTCNAGQCSDCRMSGEVSVERWERLTGQKYPDAHRYDPGAR